MKFTNLRVGDFPPELQARIKAKLAEEGMPEDTRINFDNGKSTPSVLEIITPCTLELSGRPKG